MGIGVVDALSGKPHSLSICVQEIVGVIDAVTALEQYGAMAVFADLPRRHDHVILVFNAQSAEHLRLWDVRRDERRQWQQFIDQRLHSVRLHQG